MPELGPYGSVRGARGNSRPYRESRRGPAKPTRMRHARLFCPKVAGRASLPAYPTVHSETTLGAVPRARRFLM